jgi:hypothetical protein
MTVSARRLQLAIVIGLLVFLGGIGRDLGWHATHDTQREFETASTQVVVHWLLWVGALMLLVTGVIALRRPDTERGHRGFSIAVLCAVVYAVVSVWHFIEHANGNDPQVAHVFLDISAAGIVAATVAGLVLTRRGARPLDAY